MSSCIVWFRKDLRLKDNPALDKALKAKHSYLIPLFIYNKGIYGSASKWWLHHSLSSLENDLKKQRSKLIIKTGEVGDVFADLIKEHRVEAIYFNHGYELHEVKEEKKIAQLASKYKCTCEAFHGNILFPPGTILNTEGKPFHIYSAFQRKAMKAQPVSISSKPKQLPSLPRNIKGSSIDQLRLLPKIHWTKEIETLWKTGEKEAEKKLKFFIKNKLRSYGKTRNIPSLDQTSLLSPHLHFGEIAPATVFQTIKEHLGTVHHPFLQEMLWREFAYHLLYFFPKSATHSFRKAFETFPWKNQQTFLRKWQKGMTGYPIVDAGMRQLWRTGWMHNRVRMIVASFLTKDLLIPWQKGAAWFLDTLVDADVANNALNWQWVAGSGADAAPFFRIFHPITQGKKFDPTGEYVRKYVPELRGLSFKWIHEPWKAPEEELKQAHIVLGRDYPLPMIDHDEARKKALDLFRKWRSRHG